MYRSHLFLLRPTCIQSPLAPAVPMAPPLVRPPPSDLSFDKFVERYESDLEQRQVCECVCLCLIDVAMARKHDQE